MSSVIFPGVNVSTKTFDNYIQSKPNLFWERSECTELKISLWVGWTQIWILGNNILNISLENWNQLFYFYLWRGIDWAKLILTSWLGLVQCGPNYENFFIYEYSVPLIDIDVWIVFGYFFIPALKSIYNEGPCIFGALRGMVAIQSVNTHAWIFKSFSLTKYDIFLHNLCGKWSPKYCHLSPIVNSDLYALGPK